MMGEIEDVSSLIGDLYDAALEPSLWTSVLKSSALFVGGSGASLYAKDTISKSGAMHHHDGGISEDCIQLYFTKYVRFDPSTTAQFCYDVGQPFSTADLMPYADFLKTRFYKEWVQPQHLVDHIAVVLERSSTGMALFGVFRHERDGVVDDEARRRMHLIIPHVRRAVLIGRVIDVKSAEAASFADSLDSLSAGVFLVDEHGRLIHANAAGQSILTARHVLRTAGGRLAASDTSTDETLRQLFAATGGSDLALGTKGIAVPLLARDGERFVAHILPLRSGARRRGGRGYAASAAVFVRKAVPDAPLPPEVVSKTFKLTPGELRVLLALVEVGGVTEAAEVLGIAETTAKWHLQHLFEKTGTHRQAELVKLVAGFSNPLLS
jgi:DNA-binding CsgD family transcriptional regulator/PAS domain-containing protein